MSTPEPGYCPHTLGSDWPVNLPLAILQIRFAVLASRNVIKSPPDANLQEITQVPRVLQGRSTAYQTKGLAAHDRRRRSYLGLTGMPQSRPEGCALGARLSTR